MLGKRFSKLGTREQAGLLVSCVAVALLLIDNLVVQPVVRSYDALGADIKVRQKELAYAQGVVDLEGEILERFSSVEGVLGEALPEPVAIDLMKGRIDELAKGANVLLFSMKHRPVKDMGFYREYAVEIGEFEADETGLLRFLHSLRAEESIYRVSKLDVKPDPEGTLIRGSMLITRVSMPPGVG